MNRIHLSTLSVALVLALVSEVWSAKFGLTAIEAMLATAISALATSIVLIWVASLLVRCSEPAHIALEVLKTEIGAIVAFVRDAIRG